MLLCGESMIYLPKYISIHDYKIMAKEIWILEKISCIAKIYVIFATVNLKVNNIQYPIGIQGFEQIVEGGYLYIDKTRLVYDLVHNATTCFLGRPRRFGKSLLVSTLECYFKGRKQLFKGLSMEQSEKEWKEYPVFHLDFNGHNFTKCVELEAALLEFVERHSSPAYHIVSAARIASVRRNATSSICPIWYK